MGRYFLRRLSWLVPTWFFISLVAFGLSRLAPGDPAQYYLESRKPVDRSGDLSSVAWENEYRQTAELFGLDLPPFYFSLQPAAYPDTLHRILPESRQIAVRNWLRKSGHWPAVSAFYRLLLEFHHRPIPEEFAYQADFLQWRRELSGLLRQPDTDQVEQVLRKWSASSGSGDQTVYRSEAGALAIAWEKVRSDRRLLSLYRPELVWHGRQNQFHRWFTGLFTGKLGRSFVDGRPVSRKIGEALPWTLLLNGCALFVALLVAWLSGIWMATQRGRWPDRLLSLLFFLGYAIPTFWLGTLLLLFFATPDYGMKWFPALGPAHFWKEGESLLQAAGRLFSHFFLPVLCLATGALAYLSRQVRSSLGRVLDREYILAARARGLPERKVIWQHAAPNALFPVITILAGLLPALLAGSLVVEVIFNLYGMGMLAVQSVFARDWPTLFGILQMGAVLTLGGLWLADIGYVLADPRVRFQTRKSLPGYGA